MALNVSNRQVEAGLTAEPEGEGLLRRAVPGEGGGIVAGNSDPDPVAGRDDGGDGPQCGVLVGLGVVGRRAVRATVVSIC